MKNTTRIGVVLCISFAFFLAEIIIGFRTKSLALIADAFHYLNDIVAYAIAFVAAHLHENRKHDINFTFAFHRAELVGAFFNGVFLLALALSIFLQSVERFINMEPIDSPFQVLIIGCVGLCLNIISALVVHDHGGHGHGSDSMALAISEDTEVTHLRDNIHALHNHTLDPPTPAPQHNLNLVGVLVHLFGDAINNIAVIIAATIIWKLHSPQRFYADPAVSLAISFIIFGSAIPMTLKSGRILLEAAPLFLDLEKVKSDLLSVPNVLSVHDLHVWHLSQAVILASLHVCVPPGTSLEEWEKTEACLQHCFSAYGISHVTISPEIFRESQLETQTDELPPAGKCSLPSQDEFGCAVSELKRRKTGV
ncbi:putative cation efflux family protein [Lyophyllum shimeji]|uniref:Cation efflux family protein n=1 Tax=Lyophyllum shimeji TaxID=47721 RepID=A0A9P3PTE2_LYOSH|nr:putative cation efflux family protein [Lyophyllum shimeji]